MTRLEFDVFGHRLLVIRSGERWVALYPGSEGKHRPAEDILIPPEIREAELERYLTDLCHEWASPEHSRVRCRIGVRRAVEADAASVEEVHRRAVEAVDRRFYSDDEITSWAGRRDAETRRARFADRLEGSVFLIADRGSRLVGFAQMIVESHEVRALYVDPRYGRRGVGAVLLDRLEEVARERELPDLELKASLNAAPFYLARGYERLDEATHRLADGTELRCVRMRKELG